MVKDRLKDKVILVTSNEKWGDVWFSKQNYAYELSKNNKVYFIDPPQKWSMKNLFDARIVAESHTENLVVLKYKNPLPILNKFFFLVNDLIVSRRLRNFFKKHKTNNIIYWAFDPVRLPYPKRLNADISIFHSVDLYNFRHFGEKILANNVDYIFCISSQLVPQYSSIKGQIPIVPHGISDDEFNVLETEDKPVINAADYGLYSGTIDERIDYELLEKMLLKYPKLIIMFIGPMIQPAENSIAHDILIKKKYSNFIYKEPVNFKKLKYYVEKASFGIDIKLNTLSSNTVSSHRLLQFLALGKPVFFNRNISDYNNVADIVYMSNNEDELLEKMAGFMKDGEPEFLKSKRVEFARESSFPEIFKRVEKYIGFSGI